MKRTQYASRNGFTVIEVLIAIVITSIILLTVVSLYVQSGQTTMVVRDRSTATFGAQEAVERLVDEVRRSDYFESIGAESFAIVLGSDKAEYIFDKTNGTISKNSIQYASGITDFELAYYDIRGNAVTAPANAERMTISITVTERDVEKTIETSVIMRRRRA